MFDKFFVDRRCPWCGKKGLNGKEYFLAKYDYNPNTGIKVICDCCGKAGRFMVNNLNRKEVLFTVLLVIVLGIFLVLYKFIGFWCLAFAPFALVASIAYNFYCRSSYEFLPCDIDDSKPIIMKDNAQCIIMRKKKILPNTVYGLKFETETDDTKFKEAFPDGMVPAVFHPTSEGSLTYDVRIIKPEFVPEAVLFEGAKFLVEDYDGIFIAKGTVETLSIDRPE